MTGSDRERDVLAGVIRAVTDSWDEPLDEVHDVPQIVNALLASDWLAEHEKAIAAKALREAADAALEHYGTWGGAGWAYRLRDRADRIEADQ